MKRIYLAFLMIFCAAFLFSCGEKERYVYTESDKTPYSLMETRFLPSGMETNTLLSDLIFEGKVLSNAEQVTKTFEGGVPLTFTSYEVEVENIWYGEESNNKITVWFMGTTPELHKNDVAVLYTAWNEENNCYMPVDNECSVFILNPPEDMLFSLTNAQNLLVYAGTEVVGLQQQTQEILESLQENGSPYAPEKNGLFGNVAKPYYEEYLSSIESDVTK